MDMIDPQFLIRYCISREDNIRDREREGVWGGVGEIDSTWRCILHCQDSSLFCIVWHFLVMLYFLITYIIWCPPLGLLRCHRNAMLSTCDPTPAPWLNMRIPQHASGRRPPFLSALVFHVCLLLVAEAMAEEFLVNVYLRQRWKYWKWLDQCLCEAWRRN